MQNELLIIYNVNVKYYFDIIKSQLDLPYFEEILDNLSNNNVNCFTNKLNFQKDVENIKDKTIFLVYNASNNIKSLIIEWNKYQLYLKNSIINSQQIIPVFQELDKLSKVLSSQSNIMSHCTLKYHKMLNNKYVVEIYNVCKSFIYDIKGIGSFFMIKVLYYLISEKIVEIVWLGVRLENNDFFDKATKAYIRSGFNNPYISNSTITEQKFPYYFLNLNFRILKKDGTINTNDIQLLDNLYENSINFIQNNNTSLEHEHLKIIDNNIFKAMYLKEQFDANLTPVKSMQKYICQSYNMFSVSFINYIYNIYIYQDKEIAGSLNTDIVLYTKTDTKKDFIYLLNIYTTDKLIEYTYNIPSQQLISLQNNILTVNSNPDRPDAVDPPFSNISYHIHPVNLYIDLEFGSKIYGQSLKKPLLIAPPSLGDLKYVVNRLFNTNLQFQQVQQQLYKPNEIVAGESDNIFKTSYIFCLEGIYQVGFTLEFLEIFHNIISTNTFNINYLKYEIMDFIDQTISHIYYFDNLFEKSSLFNEWFYNDNNFETFANYWCDQLEQIKFTSKIYNELNNIEIFDIQFKSWLTYGKKIITSKEYLSKLTSGITYDTKQKLQIYWYQNNELLPIGAGGYFKSMIKIQELSNNKEDNNKMDIVIDLLQVQNIDKEMMDIDNTEDRLFLVNFVSDSDYNCFLNSFNRKKTFDSYKLN